MSRGELDEKALEHSHLSLYDLRLEAEILTDFRPKIAAEVFI